MAGQDVRVTKPWGRIAIRAKGDSGEYETLRLNDSTRALLVADKAKDYELQGKRWVGDYQDENIADGTAITIGLRTPSGTKYAHMTIIPSASLGAFLFIEEADATWATAEPNKGSATLSTAGAAIVAYNKNRNVATAPTLTSTHATIGVLTSDAAWASASSSAHVEIYRQYMSGAGDTRPVTFVLKANTEYLITLESDTAANNIGLVLDWFEHTDLT